MKKKCLQITRHYKGAYQGGYCTVFAELNDIQGSELKNFIEESSIGEKISFEIIELDDDEIDNAEEFTGW